MTSIIHKIRNVSKTKLLIAIAVILFLSVFAVNAIDISKQLHSDLNKINWENEAENELKENREEIIKHYDTENEQQIITLLIKDGKKRMTLVYGFFTAMLALIVTVIKMITPMIIILGVYFWLKKYYKYRLTESAFTASENQYYRDILNEYSVDVLTYIDDFKLEYPSVLLAMLLELENKKIITLTENAITINNDIDITNLSNTEKYILGNIKDNKLHLQSTNEYEKIVEEEAMNKKLLVAKDYPRKKLVKDVTITIIGFISVVALLIFTFSKINSIELNNNPYLILGIMALLFILPIILFIYLVSKIIAFTILRKQLQTKFHVVSQKGNDIRNKLNGLENFLRDFSTLSERSKEEVTIWKEYLIYSVLFNQNNAIVDKYKNNISINIL